MNFGGVDGVAHVVALAVGDVGDEALRLAQLLADELHDVDVPHLVVAAHVIHLTHTALADNEVDGPAVVLYIQPVPDVQPLAVHRQRLVHQGVGDHQGDQLLGEMVGAVVVGAAGDSHGQAVSPMIGQHQQVGPRLGGGVRAAGVDGCLLSEEQVGPVQRQVAVDLVGGHLVIPLDAVLPAGVHHHGSAQDIGLEEHLGVLNGAVHMALRCEVDHNIGVFLLKELVDGIPVTDVDLAEAEVGVLHGRFQGGQVARIGQAVHAHHPVLRVIFQQIVNEVAADKAGTAGHEVNHRAVFLSYLSNLLRNQRCTGLL